MSDYVRASKACMLDWERMSAMERENLLEVLGMPKSEAAVEWTNLRPQVQLEMIVHEMEHVEATSL